ncbi:hypothetical protein GCM10027610_018480 [Dactylosporangium cerinum]
MPDQLYLLGNIVIMTAYAAIMVAIVVPVVRAGQLLTNKLAVATALIFFSCAVGHGMHALLSYRSILHGHGTSSAWSWSAALWDAFTAVVGIYYWTLRRGYGVLLDKGAMYVEPGRQDRIDAAGERERVARAAAESHRATLAAVVEHTADAIIGSTPDGVITAWNAGAERLFGYPAGEAIGRHADVLTSGEGTAEQEGLLARIRAGERSLSYEAQRVHKDGSPLEVAFTVAPIEDHTGTLIGISVVARDIAAAKEAAERQRAMQERTHQAQRMESLGKLAGGVRCSGTATRVPWPRSGAFSVDIRGLPTSAGSVVPRSSSSLPSKSIPKQGRSPSSTPSWTLRPTAAAVALCGPTKRCGSATCTLMRRRFPPSTTFWSVMPCSTMPTSSGSSPRRHRRMPMPISPPYVPVTRACSR